MQGGKGVVRDPAKMVQMLRDATLGEVLVEVVPLPAGETISGHFICSRGNLGKRESLIVTLPDEENRALLASLNQHKNLLLRFTLGGNPVEMRTQYLHHRVLPGPTPCMVLAFPRELRIQTVRDYARVVIPDYLQVLVTVAKRDGVATRVRVSDVGLGGFSFRLTLPSRGGAGAALPFAMGDFLKMELSAPLEGKEVTGIPLNGVVRRVTRARTVGNLLEVIVGMEIMLVAEGYKGRYYGLVSALEAEMAQHEGQWLGPEGEGLSECDQLTTTHPEVYEAIQRGSVEAMIDALRKWYQEPELALDLAQGLARLAHSPQLLQAVGFLLGLSQGGEPVQLLVAALLQKNHFDSLVGLLKHLPDDSVWMVQVLDHLVGRFGGSHLVAAVAAARGRPRAQMRLISFIAVGSTGPRLLFDCLLVVGDDQRVVMLIVQLLCDATSDPNDLIGIFSNLRVSTEVGFREATALVVRRMVAGQVSSNLLVTVLDKYVTDQGEAGLVIAAELSRRGDPEAMLDAFGYVAMDSQAAQILATGIAESGDAELMREAQGMAETSPKAKEILDCALEQFGLVGKVISALGDPLGLGAARKSRVARLKNAAKRASREALAVGGRP